MHELIDKNDLEHSIILLLSKNPLNDVEIELLRNLMNTHMDWSKVMGLLSFHRISAVAWKNIKKYILADASQRFKCGHLINYLEFIYSSQEVKALEQLHCIEKVCTAFEKVNIRYVIQKGIILSSFAYQDIASRISNDTDIIVHMNDVMEVQSILKSLGYSQGNYDFVNNKLVPAERKEIVMSTLVSHEVYPFTKVTNEYNVLKSHQVDIQFSVDLMTNVRTDSIVEEILARRKKVKINDSILYTTDWEDLLIFTSIHFYKEAAILSEVLKYKDLLLYKICDLYYILTSPSIKINWKEFVNRTKSYGFTEAIYYALYYVESIFGNIVPHEFLEQLKPSSLNYLQQVYKGTELKFEWNDEILDRVFKMNRPSQLCKENIY
ncbi:MULTISPECIES: nucleotidyltransferase family protein [Bacillus cereus group]|uniref:nucleotidyltransferase family protein n=1 Tax=Bacillus cereus group TaxID=86661 RepID=UPI001F5A00C7|nr:nucleotidyltransferase family protein [Bacillus pacificus]MED0823851.1 nucleotidyltransferase family protein [Bacillus pacificus]